MRSRSCFLQGASATMTRFVAMSVAYPARGSALNRHAHLHAAGDCCGTHAKPRSYDTLRIAWAKLPAIGIHSL
jgi:hypothetical protein